MLSAQYCCTQLMCRWDFDLRQFKAHFVSVTLNEHILEKNQMHDVLVQGCCLNGKDETNNYTGNHVCEDALSLLLIYQV